MGKRGNGEGSIYRTTDGRWRAAIISLEGRRRYLSGKSRAEVSGKLRDAANRRDRGGPPVLSGSTVERLLTAWLDATKASLKGKTWERYEGCVRIHLVPILGQVLLSRLTAQHLQALYSAKIAEGKSSATVHQLHGVVRTALAHGVQWGVIASNPALNARAPSVRPRPMSILSEDECRRFVEAVKGNRLEALFLLAVTTGMRQGEILALRWRDIDLDAGSLSVRGTLSRTREGFIITDPKTTASRRQVILPKIAVEALKRHRIRRTQERPKVGAGWSNDDLVFSTLDGRPYDKERVVRRYFRPILERAGLPTIRFHDLRHTAATLMLQRGVLVRVVADILGHADPAITLRVYSHVIPAMHGAAAKAMDAALSAGTGHSQ